MFVMRKPVMNEQNVVCVCVCRFLMEGFQSSQCRHSEKAPSGPPESNPLYFVKTFWCNRSFVIIINFDSTSIVVPN